MPTEEPTSMPTGTPSQAPDPPKGKGFRFDSDENEKISQQEFDEACERLGITFLNNYSYYDKDGDGEISFEEMVNATTGRNPVNVTGNPWDIDRNDNDIIERIELERFWEHMGFNFTEREKNLYVNAYDLDGDGEIAEQEFMDVVAVSASLYFYVIQWLIFAYSSFCSNHVNVPYLDARNERLFVQNLSWK